MRSVPGAALEPHRAATRTPGRVLMVEALPYHGAVQVGSHHYARQFMEHGHRVFWLGPAHHPWSALKGALGDARHTSTWSHLRNGPEPLGGGSYWYQPTVAVPFRDVAGLRSEWLLRYSLRTALRPLRPLLERLGFHEPEILWLSQTWQAQAMLDATRPGRSILRLSDHYAGLPKVNTAALDAEQRLLGLVDHVLVCSETLRAALPTPVRGRAVLLRNGVDCDHFGRELALPPDLAAIPAPRALFAGTIGPWVDRELLREVAARLPDIHFVVLGPTLGDSPIESSANLHVLGERPYEQLPAYLRHAHVGLIPFVRSLLTERAAPVKLYEYLAAGLPVVATDLAELRTLAAPMSLASDAATFAAAVRRSLEATSGDEGLAFARANSWSARYESITDLLEVA